MITNADRLQLRRVLSSNEWKILEVFIKEYSEKLRDEAVDNDTEWAFIRTSLLKEGKFRGITGFIQELYVQIQEQPNESHE